jgi:phage protein D/phage baseplate assembly protein gpV
MSITGTTSAQIDIEVEGAPLDPLVRAMLVSAEVDTTLFVPSQFKLVFRGSRDEVLMGGGFQLAVEILLQVQTAAEPIPLMMGEVTSVEIDYGPEGDLTVVRGLDRSHRLMRGTQTMAYPEMTASDVVTALVAEAGVPPGEITPTENLYEWLTQANVSAWVFIQQLCALENYVAYVDAMGLFCFGPMTPPEEAGPPVMSYEEPPIGPQLVLGLNLVRLRAVVSAAEQVPEVTVNGWNPMMGMPVVGPGEALVTSSQSLDPAVEGAAVAAEFAAKPLFDSSRPFSNEQAATTRAEAIATDIASALAELEGQCLGNPSVLAGKAISLGMAGPPFDGNYTVSSARHVFDAMLGGYTTWFTVGGKQDRSMLALASGQGGGAKASRPEIPGVVIGEVMDNADVEAQGRVKVGFPWLADTYVSAWAPVVQLSASESFGSLWLPEIGDEVLVGFDRGNVDYPYVLGCLYNGTKMPEPPPETEGVVGERRIMSRARHMIEFNDGPELLNIKIVTGDETVSMTLDAEEMALNIVSAGQVNVEAADVVSIKAAADMSFEAGGAISIQAGGDVSIEAGGEVSVDAGGEVGVAAGGEFGVEAPAATITAAEIMLGA